MAPFRGYQHVFKSFNMTRSHAIAILLLHSMSARFTFRERGFVTEDPAGACYTLLLETVYARKSIPVTNLCLAAFSHLSSGTYHYTLVTWVLIGQLCSLAVTSGKLVPACTNYTWASVYCYSIEVSLALS